MKTLVAFPSTAIFGQQAALAFEEHGELDAYLTSFVHRPGGILARLLAALPGGHGARILRELERRAITALPDHRIEARPFWEIVRTVADKAGLGRVPVDKLWDHLSRDFTRAAGRRLGKGADAIYAYEYTALEAFAAADRTGAFKILDFPSLNSRQYQELQRAQKAAHPELAEPEDAYFERLFESRQARRDAEMAAADLIITNSSVTRTSHIAGGADPAKTFAVPYGAPPTIERVPDRANLNQPVSVVWAGTFSIRKGAHLLIDAWRDLGPGSQAELDVYGAVALPDRMWKPAPAGIRFHGSVIRPRLFAAFERADVLIFPTLSDGFGMVVTEAFARGLPVITTDQAGASDLVRHGENGLIIPAGDTQAIADALRWCMNNRSQLQPMAEAALETAKGWQWSDYRRNLYSTVRAEMVRQGRLKD